VDFIVNNWMLIAVAAISGGLLLWPALQGNGAGLGANEAVMLINREKAVVVDVGDAADYAAGHIGGSRHVPLAELEQRLPDTVKNKQLPVLLVCPNGMRARRALATARKLGYEKAQVLAGGLKAWKDANLPLEKA